MHWGESVYTGSHCVALGHNLVGLWFFSLHWGFLIAYRGICWGHIVGWCVVVCIAGFLVCRMVVDSGCSRGLLLLWIMFKLFI